MARRDPDTDAELDEIHDLARPVAGSDDLDPLVEAIGDARYVLLGEASHGTADFYRWRAALTERLIAERGFDLVAVEGDWPDCFAVNRWVKGRADEELDARAVLGRFDRWPTWMWANEEVAGFAAWLREHNRATGRAVGFYGLDVYSLWDSLQAVVDHVEVHHPEAAEAAREAWRCFEPYDEDPQAYAWASRDALHRCEDEVVDLLVALRRDRGPVADDADPEAGLDAEQNAAVVDGSERYYRTMVRSDGSSWNVRDCHMADTLDRLVAHHGTGTKAIVWEHNTHVGDARATDMAWHGMLNVGQVVRERHDGEAFLVGFAGHRGEVVAAESWGAPARRMRVPPAPAGTHEDLLASVCPEPALVLFGDDRRGPWLSGRRGHRAIGVVYRPEGERRGNWVPTVMGGRYDALVSLGDTGALHPLHGEPLAPTGELDTFPWSG